MNTFEVHAHPARSLRRHPPRAASNPTCKGGGRRGDVAASNTRLADPSSTDPPRRAGRTTLTVEEATVKPPDLPSAEAAVDDLLDRVLTGVGVQGRRRSSRACSASPTATTLQVLADRDHPLLRELEQEALGTYIHSLMVATLTERACRAIGADPLLGTVAALYHDIGKVRQPQFFIENQQEIANPHDDLDPEVSAVIIQNHVSDGVELATQHHFPPEVIACIGSHHGTMIVGYFYEQAVRSVGGDADAVDEQRFRHSGTRPRSKEAAVLMLADCSEATTRAMAMTRGTLPREAIEATVDDLLQDRLEDHQFVEAEVTLRELQAARDTIVESLVGIYHPRIAYPERGERLPSAADDDAYADAAAGAPEPDEAPR
jgi:cyclic-di-AMP phosphodiesterase PgpH